MSDFILTDEKICFPDLEIFLLKGDNSSEYLTRDDVLYMFKTSRYVESYEKIKFEFDNKAVRNILEIGIFRGGGTPFLQRLFDAQRVVCVDIVTQPVVPLENYRQNNPDAVAIHYGIDQGDRSAMARVLKSEFADAIDLVVDDASHMYEETKAAFETVFPFVRPGGVYVIEDWNWAHGPEGQLPTHYLADKVALSNLVFELVILYGSVNGIIDHIAFGPGMMWVRRGWQSVPEGDFRLDDYMRTRGRALHLI